MWGTGSLAVSGEGDATTDGIGQDATGRDDAPRTGYRPDSIGIATRLLDVLRNAITGNEVTAGSQEISAMLVQLHQFETGALSSDDELGATIFSEQGRIPEGSDSPTDIPRQEQVRSIKSQQVSASREREKMIQGIQNQPDIDNIAQNGAPHGVFDGFGDQDLHVVTPDSDPGTTEPTVDIRFGLSTSFSAVRKQVAKTYTLNHRQSIAVRLIYQQLDRVYWDKNNTPQLCEFIGSEGGTGKSRIIAALIELFKRMGQSHRLLVTATSGTAAANINGVTIHSACRFSKDTIPRSGRYADVDRFALPGSGGLRIDGQTKMNWQEKYLLIVDEVSMLGARTLHAVNEQLCRLRESRRDFGGIPIVLFCGDFHQFRPVEERSILLPSSAFPWNEGNSFTVEQRR